MKTSKLVFFLLLGCLAGQPLVAQTEPVEDSVVIVQPPTEEELPIEEVVAEAPEKVVLEDTVLHPNTFSLSPDTVQTFRRSNTYAYIPLVDSFFRAAATQKIKVKPPEPVSIPLWIRILTSKPAQMLYWAIAIAVVVFILYRLFLEDGNWYRRYKRAPSVYASPDEFLEESVGNWEALALAAEQRKDFRQAMRYHHRALLDSLHEQQRIAWAPDKTNTQYIREMRQQPGVHEFIQLTRAFEYVWFGGYAINEVEFVQWKQTYATLQNQIR